MYDKLNQRMSEVHDAHTLAAFLHELRNDLKNYRDEWENWSLDDYLESIGAFLEDVNPTHPDTKSESSLGTEAWQMMAMIFLAGKYYE